MHSGTAVRSKPTGTEAPTNAPHVLVAAQHSQTPYAPPLTQQPSKAAGMLQCPAGRTGIWLVPGLELPSYPWPAAANSWQRAAGIASRHGSRKGEVVGDAVREHCTDLMLDRVSDR